MNRTAIAFALSALFVAASAADHAAAQDWPSTRPRPFTPVHFETNPARDRAIIYDCRDILRVRAALSRGTGTEEAALVKAGADTANASTMFMVPALAGASQKVTSVTGQIVAYLNPTQHEWLRGFLMAQRARPVAMVRVECHAALVPTAAVAALGLSSTPLPLDTIAARDAFVKRMEATAGAVVLPTQSSPLLAGTMGQDDMFEEIACITGYTRHEHVQPGDQTLVVPTVEVIRAGMFMAAMPVLLPENRIGCSFTLTHRTVEKPIAQKPSPLGTITTPVVSTTTVEAKAVFAPGSTIAFVGGARDGMQAVVTVTVSHETMDAPKVDEGPDKK